MSGEIIAVVGMTGSGKSEVSDFLTSRGYQFLRFGQITLDKVKEKGLEPTEENEKGIREGFRKEHGPAAYAILNKPKIDELLEKGNVVADNLCSWSEYKFLKDTYGNKLKVLAVNTPREIRYNRLRKRETDKDMRGRPATREQAESRDFAEIENIEKGGPIAIADIIVNNSGTKEDLVAQLVKIFGGSPRPTWDEYFIDITKIVAERATCDRGRTACVIVKDKHILVTGYAGSPKGIPHCDEVGHQFKKIIHEDGSVSQHCVRTAHAEQNAICQAAKLGVPLEGGTLYCKMTPCYVCAKMIINSGIIRVVSEKDYHASSDSKEIFKQARIKLDILNKEMEQYKGQ